MKKQIQFLWLVSILAYMACNNHTENKKEVDSTMMKKSITEKPFGFYMGKQVRQCTLTNNNGMQVSIINYGGRVTSIIVADKNKVMGDVILGYDTLEGYLQKGEPYFGALVGRYANRIANGKFTLDGKEYTLAGNDHGNSLHGGVYGFDKVWWNIETPTGDSTSLHLSYPSRDTEEGYPGNLTINVVYTLTDNNELKIEYTATTDKATPANFTSHCYFNLSAGKDSTILGHQLELNADKYTPVNDNLIPTGEIADVKNTPMDFTTAKTIGKDIQGLKGGYDHNWILNKPLNESGKAASLYEPVSGRYMEVFTTEPGLQFYSGNFLDGTLAFTKNGQKYVKYGALCLEAQHYPDSPNEPSFPNTILKPGETYRQTTVYKFSVK